MAGESPDKSEQRKSSGETAREPDPRLAVFRESPADRDAAATTGTTTGTTGKDATPEAPGSPEAAVDHSTAVFAVRGARGGSGAAEAAETPVTAAEGSSAGPAEAVRPAGSPEREPEPELESTTEPESEPKSEAGAAPGASGRRTGVAPANRTPEAGPGPGATAGPAKSADGPEPARPVTDPASDAEPEIPPAKPETKPEATPTVPQPTSESKPDTEPAGPAAEREQASDAKSGGARPAADSGADTEAAPEAVPSGSDRSADGQAASGAKPGTAPAGAADGQAASGAKPEVTSGRTRDGAPAGAAAEPERGADAKSEAPRPADDQGASGAKPEAASETKPGAAPAGAVDVASAKSGAGSGRTADGAAAKPEPTSDSPAGPSGTKPTPDEPGVDRKTAVFKALKRPGVDQPTTTLKLPPQPPAPEAPAERTSKFVPLRSDEVRAPAQPPAPPGIGVVEAERTRQQPMPPLPPLDLLAELTNKPAPPETSTRTVVRRVKIWTPLLVLALVIFAVVQAVRPLPAPSLNLTAKDTYTFEGDKPALPWPGEGQGFMAATGLGTVGSFGEQKAVPIGSVAKAMTAYVVLKGHPLDKGAKGPSIKVDAKAEEDGGLDAQGESTLNTVKEGDKLTQHDALAALMIPSANNIARLLARWDANGSEEAFVKKMNDTAEELGMKNTKYTDPSGLDATTVSSAEDQVKLGQELVEIEALMDITKMPEWQDPSGKTWRNYNTLVPYDGALGIKTGSTTKAGGNLLFAAHKMVGDTDQLIVGAVLGQHKSPIIDTVNAVSKDVMRATQDELEGATIVKKGQVVGEIDNGMGTTAPVVTTEDVKAVGWSGLTVKLEISDEGKNLPQSAAAGTHVGLLTVGEGKSRVEVAVALQGDLAEPTFGDKLTRVG